jgi:hypothetical protein
MTCPVKTALAVPKTLETAKNLIFKGSWHRANRRYIYVAYGQVLTNKYIYIRLGTIQIVKHGQNFM